MRIVVALGGNALLRRGEPMTVANQRANIRRACERLAPLATGNELVVSHGNGPQVGLLALQASAYRDAHADEGAEAVPLDVLGSQTEGMIGYLIEQELGNLVPEEQGIATLLTMTEVDPDDPAFGHPSKPIGPVYGAAEATRLAREHGWTMAPDGAHVRRVVPSPVPRAIVELRAVKTLLAAGYVVICAGGGGIPVLFGDPERRVLRGVEAVIDKDLASALLARELHADVFVMATDVPAVQTGWGTPRARSIRRAAPDALRALGFAAGSMGPKVRAAIEFAELTGRRAAIGALEDIGSLVAGEAGTVVDAKADGIEYRQAPG